jgi:hypothetical protein
MAATRKPQRAVLLDAQEPHELADALYTDDLADATDTGDASLCPTCGEPLTWHEEACRLPGEAQPELASLALVAEPAPRLVGTTYAYDLGRLVQPATQQQAHPIVWRGQLKERHPATGLVHRVNVYRLNDGYWDCYREEELLAA